MMQLPLNKKGSKEMTAFPRESRFQSQLPFVRISIGTGPLMHELLPTITFASSTLVAYEKYFGFSY
jgi:hypothetical protein